MPGLRPRAISTIVSAQPRSLAYSEHGAGHASLVVGIARVPPPASTVRQWGEVLMARPQTAMRLRWPLAFLLVTVLQASLLTLPQTAAQAQAPAFTSQDIGFAEGARPDAGGIERRLDGIARFAGDTAPIFWVDLDWWYVEPCRGCALRWDRLDRVVDAANARGMRVLLVLAYAPPWANGGHADDK